MIKTQSRGAASDAANRNGPPRDMLGYGANTPVIRWPNDARVAVSIVLNWEEGSELSYFNGDAKNPQGLLETPATTGVDVRDLAAESVFEYGSRVGIWRLARLMDEHQIPITLFTTALALERHEEFAAYVREKRHEPAGHGYRWLLRQLKGPVVNVRKVGIAVIALQ
jgi:peptidoglycan/xylan/chitin deacetylase (PgdA/CDA1 family)